MTKLSFTWVSYLYHDPKLSFTCLAFVDMTVGLPRLGAIMVMVKFWVVTNQLIREYTIVSNFLFRHFRIMFSSSLFHRGGR